MCIAIANYRNHIAKKTLRTCWDNNDMGAGLLYVNQAGYLSDFKELDNFENFYRAYQYIRSITKKPVILHFRIATHGKVNKENCHPFYVNENLGFVHNGIIQMDTKSLDYSDTYFFNEFLKELPENFLHNGAIVKLIEKAIDWSKLIFMDNKGNVTIVNEESGEMHRGDWYSNGTYEETPYYNVGGQKIYKGGYSTYKTSGSRYNHFDKDDEDFYFEEMKETEDQELMTKWEKDYIASQMPLDRLLDKAIDREIEKDKFNSCDI